MQCRFARRSRASTPWRPNFALYSRELFCCSLFVHPLSAVLDYALEVKRKIQMASRAMTNSPKKAFSKFLKGHFDSAKLLNRFSADEANLPAELERVSGDAASDAAQDSMGDSTGGVTQSTTVVVDENEPQPKSIGGVLATQSLTSTDPQKERPDEAYSKVMNEQMAPLSSTPTKPFGVAFGDGVTALRVTQFHNPNLAGDVDAPDDMDEEEEESYSAANPPDLADEQDKIREAEAKRSAKMAAEDARVALNANGIKGLAWVPLTDGARLFANSIREVRMPWSFQTRRCSS